MDDGEWWSSLFLISDMAYMIKLKLSSEFNVSLEYTSADRTDFWTVYSMLNTWYLSSFDSNSYYGHQSFAPFLFWILFSISWIDSMNLYTYVCMYLIAVV